MNMNDIQRMLPSIHRVGSAICIKGEAGIGKTEMVVDYCEENDIHIETLHLGNQEVGDIVGNPRDTIENGKAIMHWSKPEWLDRLEKAVENGKEVCLFLDELNRAQPDVKAASLQLILERRIHQHILPSGKNKILIAAAINPEESEHSSYQVGEMDPALIDRLIMINAEVDTESWVKWAKKNDIHNIVIRFIQDKGVKFLYNIPSDNSRRATPRSWVTVSKHIQDFEKYDTPKELIIPLISGLVGETLAASFYIYYEEFSKNINKETIIDMVLGFSEETTHIEELGELLSNELNNLNLDVSTLQELAEQFIEDLPIELSKNEDYKKAKIGELVPLYALLYSLPIETLAGVLHIIKHDNKDKLRLLANIDTLIHPNKSKELILRVQTRVQ